MGNFQAAQEQQRSTVEENIYEQAKDKDEETEDVRDASKIKETASTDDNGDEENKRNEKALQELHV